MTAAQLLTLKTAITDDPVLAAQPLNADGAFAIADAMNVMAVPDFWVWRTAMTKTDMTNNASADGTTFTWVGNGFITRSAGEHTAWQELGASVNPALANVRQAFADIFSGTGNAAANRTHLLAVARRKATRGEKLFATGTGSTALPATMTIEGSVSYQDVQAARQV